MKRATSDLLMDLPLPPLTPLSPFKTGLLFALSFQDLIQHFSKGNINV